MLSPCCTHVPRSSNHEELAVRSEGFSTLVDNALEESVGEVVLVDVDGACSVSETGLVDVEDIRSASKIAFPRYEY